MSLFLTSDERYINQNNNFQNESNTRTNFSNSILPDFFQDAPFNLALKEVYFDPNFPSLANLDSPHVITIVRPSINMISHKNFKIYLNLEIFLLKCRMLGRYLHLCKFILSRFLLWMNAV